MSRVLLTGASGYLGGHLARELCAAGHELRVLHRGPLSAELRALPLAGCAGDLLDDAARRAALSDCEFVVHSAGLVKNWERDRRRFDRINVTALDALLHDAKAAGVRRVVYTSSFFALGPSVGAKPQDESAPRPARWFTDYDRTKILATDVVRQHRAAGLDVVACLPTVIYGPGARTQGNLVAAILEDLLRGKLPGKMGDGSQIWNYAHVADVARGHRLALERGRAGQDYLLGGENRSMSDFLDLACDLAQRPRLRRHVPFALLAVIGRLSLLSAQLFGKAPVMTPGMVAAYRQHWACNDAKARADLGYSSRDLRSGLDETLRWLRAEPR
jgi:farnesol dehydrogenase